MKRADIYFAAMQTRDHRFDGKFFVGVKTTGIYCRPVCPAKPQKKNVEFFSHHLAAEKAGYRPCMRCRPECAPNSPAWIGTSAIVQRALKLIHSQDFLHFNEENFAAKFGVSARHLRRIFVREIGKTPKQLSSLNRLNLSRQLITQTSLSITDIAFAAGFSSIRRFNDAFKERFKSNPSQVRRQKIAKNSPLILSLSYRPPLDFAGLMHFYQSHQVGDLEWFSENEMCRIVTFGKKIGLVSIRNDKEKFCLLVEIDFPDVLAIAHIIARVRSMFDLDSDPIVIANSLELDLGLKKILDKHPGIRLPSGWDAFEVAVSTILGQLVSVERARVLVSQLMNVLGEEVLFKGRKISLFPSAQKIANSDLKFLKTTNARKQTLRHFSKLVAEGNLSLEPTQDVEKFKRQILQVKGIGPWSANYIAMKALRDTDSFPDTDLILARALIRHPHLKLEVMRPWRAYVAALFWREYSHELKKVKKI